MSAICLSKVLSPETLTRVTRIQSESGGRPEIIAAQLGLISDADLAQLYATQLGTSVLRRESYPAAPLVPDQLRPSFFKHNRLLPISDDTEVCILAMADPMDTQAADAVAFALGKQVHRRVGLPADIGAAIHRLYGSPDTATPPDDRPDEDRDTDLDRLRDLASGAPVIRLVDVLITQAVETGASDIHLESIESGLRVRFRIDGVLRDRDPPPANLKAAIISRLKIMAKLNIAERRLSQDARIRQIVRGQQIDLRVSTTPAIHGESVVLRILDRSALALDFDAIGFDPALLPKWREIAGRPHGVVLVTGPTGSGKTTTLYTTLRELNATERKIQRCGQRGHPPSGHGCGDVSAAQHTERRAGAAPGPQALPRLPLRLHRAGFHIVAFVGYMLKQAENLMRSA